MATIPASWISVVTLLPFKLIRWILFVLATSKYASLHKQTNKKTPISFMQVFNAQHKLSRCLSIIKLLSSSSPWLCDFYDLLLSLDIAPEYCNTEHTQPMLHLVHLHFSSDLVLDCWSNLLHSLYARHRSSALFIPNQLPVWLIMR